MTITRKREAGCSVVMLIIIIAANNKMARVRNEAELGDQLLQQHSSRGRPARSTQSSSDDDTNTKSRTSAPLAPTSFPDKTISSTSLKPYQIT